MWFVVLLYFMILMKHSWKLEETFSIFQYGTWVHFSFKWLLPKIFLYKKRKKCPQMYLKQSESTDSINIKNWKLFIRFFVHLIIKKKKETWWSIHPYDYSRMISKKSSNFGRVALFFVSLTTRNYQTAFISQCQQIPKNSTTKKFYFNCILIIYLIDYSS